MTRKRAFALSMMVLLSLLWHSIPAWGQAQHPLATTIHGSITSSELSLWCSLERRGCVKEKKMRDAVQDLVVRRELSRRFQQEALADEAFQNSRSLLLHQLAERRLHQDLAAKLPEPNEEQLQALFKSTPRRANARQWRLLNLYRRFPQNADADEKQALRQEMHGIRQRIVQGEDFSQLARQYSESETRLRGGAIGLVSLDRLAQPVAREVAQLGAGDLSPVIETKDGFTLLKILGVVEKSEDGFEKARPGLRKRWREAKLREANEHLNETLLQRFEPGSQTSQEQWLLAARAAEARSRGLLEDPEVRRKQDHAIEKLEAQTAANFLTRTWITPSTPEEIRNAFDRLEEPLMRPRRRHLEALRLPIDSRHPQAFYETARRLGESAASGALPFDQLHRELKDSVTHKDLGWQTDKQVWLLGLNVEHALRPLAARGMTPWVQEGQTLHLVRVIALEPARPLTFEQARPHLEAMLQKKARREAGSKLYEMILEEVNFEFASSSSKTVDSKASAVDGANTL